MDYEESNSIHNYKMYIYTATLRSKIKVFNNSTSFSTLRPCVCGFYVLKNIYTIVTFEFILLV